MHFLMNDSIEDAGIVTRAFIDRADEIGIALRERLIDTDGVGMVVFFAIVPHFIVNDALQALHEAMFARLDWVSK